MLAKGIIDIAKEKISNADVISFDIFDTLLLRPYVRPRDLFLHIEKALHKPMFGMCRVEAETVARKLHPELEDITLDMIYDEIDDEFKELKQKEMDWEAMVLRANPELKQVYDYAVSSGKRIVITSDMYLPAEFLANVLRKNGYDGWEKLYVSGLYGKMKATGNLFLEVLNDLNVNPSRILHIGDNRQSDIENPAKLGINTLFVQKPLDKFFSQDIRVADFYQANKENLEISIMLGVISYIYAENIQDYWQKFGFKYAGPVIYAYMAWLKSQLLEDDVKQALFVARDGYTLQKVFNLLTEKENFTTHYVYASRAFDILCNLSYAERLKRDEREALSAIKKILNYYRNQNEILKTSTPKNITRDNLKECVDFLENHKAIYSKLADNKKSVFAKYISQFINAPKVAMIDTCSIQLSSQKLLKEFCSRQNSRLIGYYWFVQDNKYVNHNDLEIRTFQKERNFRFVDWDIMEFLITSPEPPVSDLDENGNPIYQKLSDFEKYRSSVYPLVSAGAVAFTKELKMFFADMDITFSVDAIINWINNFTLIPAAYDKPYISKIYHGCDSGHSQYVPICKPWFRIKKKIHIKVLGLNLFKILVSENETTAYLFRFLPVFKYKHKNSKTELKILTIPLYLTIRKENKIKFKLFKIFPIFTIRTK
jgi:predicted HAD superfamily hydrolase